MSKLTTFVAVSVCVGAFLTASARDITFDDRLAAQKAIEQVYWDQRVWPKENPGVKPPLSAVMTDSAIRAKVEDYMAKSNALETWWRRPITAEQLQSELDRMTKNTHDGALLNKLYRALGNDAGLIAETLARQTLAERLIRNWYGSDSRFHAETKARAEAARAACDNASCLKTMSGDYWETTWTRRDGRRGRLPGPKDATVALDDDEWDRRVKRLETRFAVKPGSLPIGRISALEETAEAFSVTTVLAQRDGELTTASVVWPKRSFDAWWEAERGAIGSRVAQPPGAFTLQAAPSTACTNDTWRRTQFLAPEGRTEFVAVWTGTEMIVWGGSGILETGIESLFNGGRYNPSTDTWTPIPPSPDGPPAAWYAEAVWTGTEMIVWSGQGPSSIDPVGRGARYNPTTGTWTRTSTVNSPSGRAYDPVVWTGTEMIVWGGYGGSPFEDTGGRYNPTTDTWTPTSMVGAPVARYGHSAIWTGTEMIIWGGESATGGRDDGARYNPSTDTWTAISTGANVPGDRYYHSAFWTGTVMLVWGGEDDGVYFNTGGRYNPSTNTWASISTGANVPIARKRNSAVWTGSEMIVWGGHNSSFVNTNAGGRYNPATNTWAATSTGANVPQARFWHRAVWTGSEMIVWGGANAAQLTTGARFSPSSNTWAPISPGAGVPERGEASEVWTGSEMVVWSGVSDTHAMTNSGGRYNPALDTWSPTSLASGVPAARTNAKATWTGTEMLVWGGQTLQAALNTGGRYDPASNTWTATSTGANVPSPRTGFSSVWTGTEMIVWGGQDASLNSLNDGARYKPANNTWTPTSVGANVPDPRTSHSAVWTGSKMIVWGGADSSGFLAAGGRYDPANDSWTPTSTGPNMPAPRRDHTAVWTGTEMIVWGGSGGSELNTGGRYELANDSWSPTSTGASLPTARQAHSAIWTGEEMIVWGGTVQPSTRFNTGGRYNPLSDSWMPTSTGANVPPARGEHSAVWTGREMIVWGGRPDVEQGGVYCACPNGIGVFYRDLDGDGHGDAAATRSACSQPGGFVASAGDCDDTNAAVYSGAPELNDGFDNQCPGDPGHGIADEIADTLHVDAGGVVSWTDTSGAATFDVARSPSRNLSPCEIIGTASSGSPSVTDATIPPSGGGFYYVVRASSAHVGSWGQSSSGVERSLACP